MLDIADFTKEGKTESFKIIPKIEDKPFNNLKKELQKFKDPIDIDAKLKGVGLQDVEKLSGRIKELQSQGKLKKLEREEVNSLIQEHNYSKISEQAHGFKGVTEALNYYNKGIKDGTLDTNKFVDSIGAGNSHLASYMKNLKGAQGSMGSYGASLVAAKIKTLTLNTATMALNMALSTVVSMGMMLVIDTVISKMDSVIHYHNNAVEKAAELSEKFKESLKSISDNSKNIDTLKDDYETLSKGVDSLGRNVSLTSEEYSKYNNIVNQIADMFPEMVEGYTEEGNAILTVKGNVDALTQALERQKQASRDYIITNAKDAYEGFNEKINYNSNNGIFGVFNDDGLRQQINIAKKVRNNINNKDVLSKIFEENFLESGLGINSSLQQFFDNAGIDADWFDLKFSLLNQLDFSRNVDLFKNHINEINAYYNQLVYQLNTSTEMVKPITNALLENDIAFQQMDGEVKDVVKQIVNSLNYEFYSQSEFDGDPSKMYSWISENIVKKLQGKNGKTAVDLFDQLISVTPEKGSYKKYVDEVNGIIDEIQNLMNLDDNLILQLRIKFGVESSNIQTAGNDFMEELKKKIADGLYSGNPQNAVLNLRKADAFLSDDDFEKSKINSALDVKGDSFDKFKRESKEVNDWIDKLNKSDLDILYEINAKNGWTLDNFKNALEEAKKSAKEPISLLSFSESLEELSDFSDGFSKLDKIYSDVLNKESFDFSSLISKDFIGTFGKYAEEYQNLVNTISESPNDIEACQSAFNNLATAWLTGEDVLKNLTDETKDATIQYLNQNGVANASAIVTDMLTAKTIAARHEKELLNFTNNALTDSTDETTNSIYSGINSLLDEAGTSEIAKLSLLKLIEQQTIFNNTSLDVTQKINALRELASQAGTAGAAIATALDLENDNTYKLLLRQEGKSNFVGPLMPPKDADLTSLYKGDSLNTTSTSYLNDLFKKNHDKFMTLTTAPIEYTGSSGAGSGSSAGSKNSGGGDSKGSGTGSSSSEDTWKEAYDKEKKELDHLRKMELITDKGYFDKLTALTDKYFKGKDKYIDEYRSNAEELYDLEKRLFSDSVSLIEHQISILENDKSNDKIEEQIELYHQLQGMYSNEANRARKHGLTDSDSYIREQQKSYMDVTDKIYDLQSKAYEKIISGNDKLIDKLSLRTDTAKQKIDIISKDMDTAHKFADLRRSQGFSEDNDDIQKAQDTYSEGAQKIFDILNEEFDRVMEKKDNLTNDADFKINLLGDKDFDEKEKLLNEQLKLGIEKVNDYDSEIKKLEKDYVNDIINAAEFEKRVRSLKEEQQDAVLAVKEYHKQLKDTETAKLDYEINKITKAAENQTKAIDKQIEALEDENDELNKLKDLYDKAYQAVQKVIDDQVGELNKLKEQEEEYWNDKLEALEKINDETTRGIELSEKQKAIEKASQKTVLVYHEDTGWTHEANANELSEAQQELNQWLIDDQFEQSKKSIEEQKEAILNSIEEQIEGWNNYIDLWEDAVNAYEDRQNRIAASSIIGLNWENSTLAQRENIIRKYESNYSSILTKLDDDSENSINRQKEYLEKQKQEIETASDSQIEAIENLKAAYDELFDKTTLKADEWVIHLAEKYNLAEESARNLFEMLSSYQGDINSVKTYALKAVEENDPVIMTIKDMKARSVSWSEQKNQKDKDELYRQNEELAKTLEQYGIKVSFNSHTGEWIEENGELLYDRLKYNSEISKENLSVISENNETTENNTIAENVNTKFLKSSIAQSKKLTSHTENLSNSIEDLTEVIENSSKNPDSSNSDNNSWNSGESSSGGSSGNNTGNVPYTYSSSLKGEDINTAKSWFADKNKTYPGSKVKIIRGGASTLSSSLISQLGLKSGDLAIIGKRLYYIGSGGSYNKITSSLINGYASGCEYIPHSQTAIIDEDGFGSEIVVHNDANGRPKYLEKGSEVIPSKSTRNLTSLLENIGNPNIIETLENMAKQLNPAAKIADSFSNTHDYISNNIHNTSNVNHNYNIDKVVLEQVNNIDDIFRGLKNKALQWSYRR